MHFSFRKELLQYYAVMRYTKSLGDIQMDANHK